jgi:SAM-dependent methyltransferase
MEAAEYRRMAAVEKSHWWYIATRTLLRQFLLPEIVKSEGASPRRFLDAGCGTGATGAWLAEWGSVVALDHAPAKRSRSTPRRIPKHNCFREISEPCNFPTRVWMPSCASRFFITRRSTEPDKAVRELARVVRPGGLVCLLEPGVRQLRRGHDRETHAARRFSRGDLEQLALGAGLEIVRSTGAYSFLIPPAWVKSKLEQRQAHSDLASNASGLFGLLGILAWCERQLLRFISLPFGLSVLVIARRKTAV